MPQGMGSSWERELSLARRSQGFKGLGCAQRSLAENGARAEQHWACSQRQIHPALDTTQALPEHPTDHTLELGKLRLLGSTKQLILKKKRQMGSHIPGIFHVDQLGKLHDVWHFWYLYYGIYAFWCSNSSRPMP